MRRLLRDLHAVHPMMAVGLYASVESVQAVSDSIAKNEPLTPESWKSGLYFAMPTTSLANMPPLSRPN